MLLQTVGFFNAKLRELKPPQIPCHSPQKYGKNLGSLQLCKVVLRIKASNRVSATDDDAAKGWHTSATEDMVNPDRRGSSS